EVGVRTVEHCGEVDLEGHGRSTEASGGDRALDLVRSDEVDRTVADARRASAGVDEDACARARRVGEARKAGARGGGELGPNAVLVEIDAVVPRRGDLRPF